MNKSTECIVENEQDRLLNALTGGHWDYYKKKGWDLETCQKVVAILSEEDEEEAA